MVSMCLKPFAAPFAVDKEVKKLTKQTWSHSRPFALCKWWAIRHGHKKAYCSEASLHLRCTAVRTRQPPCVCSVCMNPAGTVCVECVYVFQTFTAMLTPFKPFACDTHAFRLFESGKRSLTLRSPTALCSSWRCIRTKDGFGPVVEQSISNREFSCTIWNER